MTPTITTIIEDEYGCPIQSITDGESELVDRFEYDIHEEFTQGMQLDIDGNSFWEDGFIWSL